MGLAKIKVIGHILLCCCQACAVTKTTQIINGTGTNDRYRGKRLSVSVVINWRTTYAENPEPQPKQKKRTQLLESIDARQLQVDPTSGALHPIFSLASSMRQAEVLHASSRSPCRVSCRRPSAWRRHAPRPANFGHHAP